MGEILSPELVRAARAMMTRTRCAAISPGGASRKVTVADLCDTIEALRSQVVALTKERDRARAVLREVLDAPTQVGGVVLDGTVPRAPTVREWLPDALRAKAEQETDR